MNRTCSKGPAAVLLGSILLAGCSGSGYLKAPVAPENATRSSAFDGTWRGAVESRSRLRTLSGMSGATMVCKPYRDGISLEVSQGEVRIQLGSDPRHALSTRLNDGGRFYQTVPLVPLTQDRGYRGAGTALWVTGQLDPATGQAQGQIGIGPAGANIGCLGAFMAKRNGAAQSPASVTEPFTTEYYVTTLRDRK